MVIVRESDLQGHGFSSKPSSYNTLTMGKRWYAGGAVAQQVEHRT